MPTPFNHLLIAGDLLAAPRLPAEARRALSADRPAFLLGNIAPDVQSITGQLREATHFFPVPLDGAAPAPLVLLRRHPALAAPARLPGAQAAFLAGYLAHLIFDQYWVRDIFEPVFGPDAPWGTFTERLYLHNALRAAWDMRDQPRVAAGVSADLSAAQPSGWLPFAADGDLRRWRDSIAHQLHSGVAETVEVFAGRMNVDPARFAALVNSPDEMERRVWSRVPDERLARFRAEALEACASLLADYWAGELQARASAPAKHG